MTISTETYDAIYDQYSAAMKWMEGLGIRLSPGRTSYYEKVLRAPNKMSSHASKNRQQINAQPSVRKAS
jgi:hypothetical protein